MRFNTVEVERAYMDYLDSLDDGPPPQGASAESTSAMTQTPDDEHGHHTRSASKPLNS